MQIPDFYFSKFLNSHLFRFVLKRLVIYGNDFLLTHFCIFAMFLDVEDLEDQETRIKPNIFRNMLIKTIESHLYSQRPISNPKIKIIAIVHPIKHNKLIAVFVYSIPKKNQI
jgi:hypothetical protein